MNDRSPGAAPAVPGGTELARPFLPTLDFELSKRFYLALGFELLLDSDSDAGTAEALQAAEDEIRRLEGLLSRFDPGSNRAVRVLGFLRDLEA